MRECITSKLSIMWVQQATTSSMPVHFQGGQTVLETRFWQGSSSEQMLLAKPCFQKDGHPGADITLQPVPVSPTKDL